MIVNSYMLLENVPEETVNTAAGEIVVLLLVSAGEDPSTYNAEELAYLQMLTEAGAEGFSAAFTEQWIISEGSDTPAEEPADTETEPLTDAQKEELSSLYTDTFGTANAEYIGKESLEGETIYHWDYTLTSEDMDAFIMEQCGIVDDPAVDCVNDAFSQYADLQNLEVWVNGDGEIRKLALTVELDLGELLSSADVEDFSSDEMLTIDTTLWLTDINSAPEIEVPEDYITYEEATDIFNSYIEDLF